MAINRTWESYTVTSVKDNESRGVHSVHQGPEILISLPCLRYPCYHSFSAFAFVFEWKSFLPVSAEIWTPLGDVYFHLLHLILQYQSVVFSGLGGLLPSALLLSTRSLLHTIWFIFWTSQKSQMIHQLILRFLILESFLLALADLLKFYMDSSGVK